MANVTDTIAYFADATARGVGDVLPYPIGHDLTQLVRSYELEYDTTGAVTAAMLLAYAAIPNAQFVAQDNALTEGSVVTTAADGTETITSDPMRVVQPDRRAFLQQFNQAIGGAKAWLRDLVACQQVGPLSVDNVSNYFLSQNGTRIHGGPILRVVNVAKNVFPRLIEIEEVRGSLTKNQFLIYHCTYSSTPGLVRRFIDDTIGFTIISDDVEDVVDSALKQYWDLEAANAIPQRIVAMARAYLEAVNSLPPNWYQGNKARAAVSPMLYSRWYNTFRVYSRLVQNLGDTDAIATLDELVARTGAENLTI